MIRSTLKFTYSRWSATENFLNTVRRQGAKPINLKNCAVGFKYISFSFINFLYVAKAEPIVNNPNLISKKESENESLNIKNVLNQADELFSMGKFEETHKLLYPYKDTEDVEVLWRLARVLYYLSKQKGIEKSKNASLIEEGFEYIDQALKLDSDHYAVQKWMAILYDAKSFLQGIKGRIKALPIFKEHLMRAIELNPRDATSLYMLGLYMYNIADMSKLQIMVAKSLFGTPPEATFEEAFYYFTKAEEVEPNFYSSNLLMLGKTCLKLKRIESARFWLKCAVSYPVTTDEDEAVRREAEDLLKKNPGKTKTIYEAANGNTEKS